MSKTLHTKFGNCSLNNVGHYRVTSRNEGNHGKLLHRLIWEDFYGCEVPKGFVIHHKNGDKLDNCILNLQLMRDKEHRSFHNTGKDNSNENNPMWNKNHKLTTKLKISSRHTKTGIYRVNLRMSPRSKKGYRWYYEFRDENTKQTISATDLMSLKKRVLNNEWDWIVVNEDKLKSICNKVNENFNEVMA